MLPAFAEHVGRIPDLFAKLNEATPLAFSPIGLPQEPAVYAFIEDQKILRIGRTGNLKRRIQSHMKQDHHSASFAFKLAREQFHPKPTYKKEGSRGALQQDTIFMQRFAEQIARLKRMHMKYILIDDPIDQYLLELYASMFYGLALDEFDNH
ncbi:MAG TPA: hypothetical protein VMU78_06245 [Methylocella sp.]|nr:hypothetical protein [Methylocella sp.]